MDHDPLKKGGPFGPGFIRKRRQLKNEGSISKTMAKAVKLLLASLPPSRSPRSAVANYQLRITRASSTSSYTHSKASSTHRTLLPFVSFVQSTGNCNQFQLIMLFGYEQMNSENYTFGPYKIDHKEVFYSTDLSYAMVNLRPLVPGKLCLNSVFEKSIGALATFCFFRVLIFVNSFQNDMRTCVLISCFRV